MEYGHSSLAVRVSSLAIFLYISHNNIGGINLLILLEKKEKLFNTLSLTDCEKIKKKIFSVML